jgi:hypothetical protein
VASVQAPARRIGFNTSPPAIAGPASTNPSTSIPAPAATSATPPPIEWPTTTSGTPGCLWFVSRTGHRIEFHDEDKAITLVTGDGNHRIVLDESGQKLVIESSGDVEITSQKVVTFKSAQAMSLECDGKLELKGMGVTIDAGAGNFEAKGIEAKVNGSARASLEGGANAEVKAPLVKIN